MCWITLIPSPLWWGYLDFIITPCESTVTITDLLMNWSIGSAANWNSEGIPSFKTALLHTIILLRVVVNSSIHWLWIRCSPKQILGRHGSLLIILSLRNKPFWNNTCRFDIYIWFTVCIMENRWTSASFVFSVPIFNKTKNAFYTSKTFSTFTLVKLIF